jgi:hypothetical protein
MGKAVVTNAADQQQVGNAKEKELRGRDRELNDLLSVMNTREGRRYVWRLLAHCKVFGSVWHGSALIHYNSGMQDVGHYILADINDLNPDLLVLMIKENKGD